MHVKLFAEVCSHNPPFIHGWESQIFAKISHLCPLNPIGQILFFHVFNLNKNFHNETWLLDFEDIPFKAWRSINYACSRIEARTRITQGFETFMLAFEASVAFWAHTSVHASLTILAQTIVHTRIRHTNV
jgi:hypothetical protein